MEHRIKIAIFTLTGLEPIEDYNSEKYHLRLGGVDPIIIGYSEDKRKLYTFLDLRYSALIAMLKTLCEMMGDDKTFEIWINKQG